MKGRQRCPEDERLKRYGSIFRVPKSFSTPVIGVTGTMEKILMWKPDIVFIAEPPHYLQTLSCPLRRKAWENGLLLANNVATLIVDHHLLRSKEGITWLDRLSLRVGKKVYCAADYMNTPRLLLEARRRTLYQEIPVPVNWHENYEKGKVHIKNKGYHFELQYTNQVECICRKTYPGKTT